MSNGRNKEKIRPQIAELEEAKMMQKGFYLSQLTHLSAAENKEDIAARVIKEEEEEMDRRINVVSFKQPPPKKAKQMYSSGNNASNSLGVIHYY